MKKLKQLENWFNNKFGWFFTNGNKQHRLQVDPVLQRLSKRSDTTLILFTCSYPNEIKEYLEFFKANGIHFKYVNENPDCPNTAFGNFDKKFYFNILLEDKAGFDALEDWDQIDEALNDIDATKVVEIDGAHSLMVWHAGSGCYFPLTPKKDFLYSKRARDCKFISPLDLTLNKAKEEVVTK